MGMGNENGKLNSEMEIENGIRKCESEMIIENENQK